MNLYGYEILREDDLMHHGIKGQKWGQRRFQNEDGTWTAAGKERYGDDGGGQSRSFVNKSSKEADKAKNTPEAKARAEKIKKAAKIGAAIAGTALVAYGAYKLNDMAKNKLIQEDLQAGMAQLKYRDDLWSRVYSNQQAANRYDVRANKGEKGAAEMVKTLRSVADRDTGKAMDAHNKYLQYTERAGRAAGGSSEYSIKEKVGALKRMAGRR